MQNDVLLGLPLAAAADKDQLRAFLVHRIAYHLEDDENPSEFVALVNGAIPLSIVWNRTAFYFDADGAITAVDGVTVIQTSDGYVYTADGTDLDVTSVLDRDLSEPPGSGVIDGDAFIIADGATGAWAGYSGFITLLSARGWLMIAPRVGNWILVEDEDSFVRYTAAGEWVLGPGQRTFEDDSIPVSAIINAARTSFIVENQTTNTPPASPTKGVAYVIGSSPTGAWAGKPLQIAVCEDDGEWSYYVPSNGFQVFDKALNGSYRYNGTAWVSAAGVWVGFTGPHLTTGTGSTSTGGSGLYTYSNTTGPAGQQYRQDDVTITHTAKRAGAALRLSWSGKINVAVGGAIGVWRDSEANAIAWFDVNTENAHQEYHFYLTAIDALQHTYKVRLTDPGGAANAPANRIIFLEEGA